MRAKGVWSLTSSISATVGLPTNPVMLTNGDVLIANDARLYDPNTASWEPTGALPTLTGPPTKAAPLGNGNVLGTGGECKGTKYYSCGFAPTNIAYLYSFAGNSWSQTGSMNYGRFYHTMTLLPSGEVLVTGGVEGKSAYRTALSTAELYTP